MSIAELAERAKLNNAHNVLIIDCERVPGVAMAWQKKTRYIPDHMWLEDPRTVCFAARWYGQKRTVFKAEWVDRDDMIQAVWDLYDKAQAVVTYNGVGFDDKVFRADWAQAGMPPPSPWKSIDLFKAQGQFMWLSKSMDAVSKRLGLDGKTDHYDVQLALAATRGDRAAQKQLRSYNEGDVDATEALYDRLRAWLPNHPHSLTGAADDRPTCHACWGDNLERTGTKLANLITYVLYRCRDCGANVQGTRHSRAAVTRGAR